MSNKINNHDHCGCGCGHDHEQHHSEHHHHEHEHDDHCGCGCGHDHEQHHSEHHHHEHEHDDHCGCGCGHDHEHHNHDEHHDHDYHIEKHFDEVNLKKEVFILENLGCANCAAKIENKIQQMPEIAEANYTFATKKLRITAENPDALKDEIQRICDSIEDGVVVKKFENSRKSSVEKANEGKKKLKEETKDIICISAGAIIFATIVAIKLIVGIEYNLPMIIGLVVAYLILGSEVLLTAIKNIFKGQVFDENFLMSIATLGAFAIAEYPEAVGVMLFFRVGELFEHIAVEKSRSQIMDAVDLRPEVVNLLEGDAVKVIDAEDAEIGDLLVVRPGDRIPLDGIITEGESRIDTSAVTGEPVPVSVGPGSQVVSGCVNTSGVITMKVEKVLAESMVTRILDSVENAAASKPKIDNFITRFARIYTPIVVALALITAVGIPLVTGDDFYPWIYTALTFLVMSCPCALVLSVPLAFFCGIGAGSKRGILFKGGIVLEALAKIQNVVMDKTGTITHGNFVVQSVSCAGGFDEKAVLSYAAAAEVNSTHPIAVSIVSAAKETEQLKAEEIKEIAGKGIEAIIENKKVLCGNVKLMETGNINLAEYTSAAGGSEVLIAVDGIFAGNIIISDTIKDEAPDAIGRINRDGITTAMLTGDSEDSANAIASKAGIKKVFAKLLPEDKLNILGEIREENGSVMFVGDGINDAPVLAGADVGAAMGSGADAAIEAADVVFMNSNMDAIPTAIEISRKTAAIAKENVIGALIIKILVMILGITGIYANMWLAVFADTGVAMICILNSVRVLIKKYK